MYYILKILPFENSVDLDKLASYEPNWSASTRFHPHNEVKLNCNTALNDILSRESSNTYLEAATSNISMYQWTNG